MNESPETNEDVNIRRLLAESEIEESPELLDGLRRLRFFRAAPAPEPTGELAALLTEPAVPPRQRQQRHRGLILSFALAGAMAAGTTGVAASNALYLSSESLFDGTEEPPTTDGGGPLPPSAETPATPAVPGSAVDPVAAAGSPGGYSAGAAEAPGAPFPPSAANRHVANNPADGAAVPPAASSAKPAASPAAGPAGPAAGTGVAGPAETRTPAAALPAPDTAHAPGGQGTAADNAARPGRDDAGYDSDLPDLGPNRRGPYGDPDREGYYLGHRGSGGTDGSGPFKNDSGTFEFSRSGGENAGGAGSHGAGSHGAGGSGSGDQLGQGGGTVPAESAPATAGSRP